MTIRWIAPAKLNLFLRITGRRSDGYHLLQTVFQFLNYGDELEFKVRDDGEIRRLTEHAHVPQEQDLVVRAARALQPFSQRKLGVDISLYKKLPMGGGVGGGSSDAATTLCVLNELWQCGLSTRQLAEIGLKLGADVPVFVQGRSAFAEGVGEHLQTIDLHTPWFLVVKPPVHVSTAEIFGDSQLTRNMPAITISALQRPGMSMIDLGNVCEPVAMRRYPEIADVFSYLEQYGTPRMTGTGACVFISFETDQQAQQVLSCLPGKWSGFIAQGCNTSPLTTQLEDFRKQSR